MQISFGQKIPIALTQIQNKKTDEFEQATIYEIDCMDENDIYEIKNNPQGWNFSSEIAFNIKLKHKSQNRYDENHHNFYILQNQNKETIGRVDIKKWDSKLFSVEWLDTKEANGYRYVGQSLLATAAKEALEKDGKAFAVLAALDDAIPFYTDICKFTDCGKSGYYMDYKQMQEFIKRTEKRTNSPIIDLKV